VVADAAVVVVINGVKSYGVTVMHGSSIHLKRLPSFKPFLEFNLHFMLNQPFRNLFVAVFGISLLLTSCNNTPKQVEDVPLVGTPDNFDYGKVENNTYTNTYFKCSMKLPKEWVVQDQDVVDELREKGKEAMTDGNKALKEQIDAASINTASLLTISKTDMRLATESNPNIILIAENVNRAPDIDNGAKYLKSAKSFLQKSNAAIVSISDDFEEEIINGTQFFRMDAVMNVSEQLVNQRYHVTISKGFAFIIIETFQTEEQELFMLDYVKSIRFEKEK
jgi:hypothetical protein